MTATAAVATSPTERRAALLAQLDALHVERGEAVLDGGCFDNAKIAAIEGELAALDDADAALSKRERTATERAEAKRLSLLRTAARERDARRLRALGAAEASFDAFVDHARSFIADAGKLRQLARELGGDVPLCLDQNEVERRLARMMAAMMQTLVPGRHTLGALKWNSTPDGYGSWLDAERLATGYAITSITTRNQERETP